MMTVKRLMVGGQMPDIVSLKAVMQEHFSEAQRIVLEIEARATLLID